MKTYEAFLISLPNAEQIALARTRRIRTKMLRATMRWTIVLILALAFMATWRATRL